MKRSLSPMSFFSGADRLERDHIKLRLAVVRATNIPPESIKRMPAIEFFILLDELQDKK